MIKELSKNDVNDDIAALVYGTGHYMPPYLFGGSDEAIPRIAGLSALEDNTFSHRHTLAFYEAGKPRGILIGYDPSKISAKKEAKDYSKVFSPTDFAFLGLKAIPFRIVLMMGTSGFYIQNLSVQKEYRKKGIGGALVESAVKKACDAGLKSMALDVAISNKNARIFYEARVFKVEKTRKMPMTGFGSYRMKRKL